MIYIVEDDINIREMEEYALKNSGFLTAKVFLKNVKQLFQTLLC